MTSKRILTNSGGCPEGKQQEESERPFENSSCLDEPREENKRRLETTDRNEERQGHLHVE